MTLVWGIPAAYVLIVVLLWALQERITFPAPRAAVPDPQQVLGYGERIELAMRDGTTLVGWYLPPTAPDGALLRSTAQSAPGLLWFYGNGETIGTIWPVIREFRPPDAALLVVDYPGYGESGGRATEAGIYEAADLAYQALVARPAVDRRRVYVYGRSLGSAPATHTAAGHDVAGLILESPFTSARDMAARHYRFFPRFLVRLRLDNVSRMARIRCPLLVFHGTEDRIVPLDFGRRLAAAAPGPVEFVMIDGADHNETYEIGGRAYRDKLWSFVRGVR
ncbi:MAG: alpha/beta hydrolase [Gemmatimonadales bacterium]